MTAKLRQHSLSSVRKLQELLHECNIQLAAYRNAIQGIGTPNDNTDLRKEIDVCARAVLRSCEATKNCVLPQLRHEGELSVEFTKHASQFIGCVSACVIEMKRFEAMEATFRTVSWTPNNTNNCHPTSSTTNQQSTGPDTPLPGPSTSSIPIPAPSQHYISEMEEMLETLENLITVHFSTTESSPADKVTPRRRRGASCRPTCVCSKLKTSYA
uniref:Mediator complex subunit 11 n=1 Tax=Rhabditophanes sp. KR3021 TaxID=114890 RepID=A0AC35U109_9BILA